MKFIAARINSIEAARGNDVRIDCDMPEGYYTDLLCEIWEQIGAKKFISIVKKYDLNKD
jgi:hypothetical protein